MNNELFDEYVTALEAVQDAALDYIADMHHDNLKELAAAVVECIEARRRESAQYD